MLKFEVSCIKKSNHKDPHERITLIGGYDSNRNRWALTQQEAIYFIELGNNFFFVDQGGRVTDIIIATSKYGHKYLKTRNDGEQPNNLLSLPECT